MLAAPVIGTAGWSLPRAEQQYFSSSGSHLERYAARFPGVEINSSFHRSHRSATWERWRDVVPAEFRFSVKVPKSITHEARLEGAEALLDAFLAETSHLGQKLGCLLVQLPPSLPYDAAVARGFCERLRERTAVPIACEPRHASWFEPEPDAFFAELKIARVAADPAPVPAAAEPGGWPGLRYYRLHGSPKIYYSAYPDPFITSLAKRLQQDRAERRPAWCIFDNTTLGAATRNALDLLTASLPR